MWVGLDAVDWAGLKHNYGSAEDIPGLLRRCGGADAGGAGDTDGPGETGDPRETGSAADTSAPGDTGSPSDTGSPDDAHHAASDLLNQLFHQGGWICSAAPAALPFLMRLATTPQVPTRCAMLELVAMLAAEARRVEVRFLDPGWAPAWERALPEVLGLLDDPEPMIRRAAADVLGVCESPGASVLPGLLRCWETEGDPATRLELALSLGKTALRAPVGEHGAEAFALLHGLLDSPHPQLRLAAVHALAPNDPGLPARELGPVLEALRDPTVELWRNTSSVCTGVRGVHRWTAALMTGPAPAFTLGLLADHHDPEQRVGSLAQAGTLPKSGSGQPNCWPASARPPPPTPPPSRTGSGPWPPSGNSPPAATGPSCSRPYAIWSAWAAPPGPPPTCCARYPPLTSGFAAAAAGAASPTTRTSAPPSENCSSPAADVRRAAPRAILGA
ncbi:HEAT repeat domain-containing protein [Streptomyces sp. SR27]|uniref:HEAT repeat domain-containing protein n=1 Tax=Streptomyces sp. SR27 TaxID=3076630 RepID=UPI00295C2F24|nr:HEAT repeat domain-containing protein [Streptomyces sp. SR27]MDV9187206.1 HEAT repeat domain-containing protein [Streptomyces sp. SR27]